MDHDEDLARALAASLQTSQPPQHQDTDSDEDDHFEADLQRAIDASKAASRPASPPKQAQPQSAFISERAQLEKARLERQKRLRGDVEEEPEVSEDDVRPAKRQHISSSGGSRFNNASSNSPSTSTSQRASGSSSSGDGFFWDGETRQTGNMYADPKKDSKPTFRLTDIIGDTSSISFAIISSYATDWEFAFKRFEVDGKRPTPIISVTHPAGADRTPGIKYLEENWIRTQPYLHTPFASMHMKFMLIFYKSGRLRIMISTANLVDYDWKTVENSAWVQDVPLRNKPIIHDAKAFDFPALFQNVLKAANVKPALDSFLRSDHPNLPLQSIEDLRRKWDFSKVKVYLISSISGKHEQWPNVIKTGHPRLMKIVRDIGARAGPSKELHLECQGSSLGKMSKKWIKEFYHSARGADAQNWLRKSGRSKSDNLPWPGNRMKVLFPSKKTVQGSVLGEPGGGTMFFQRSSWDSPSYPKELLHDSKSKRGRILMHSKMIIGTLKDVRNKKGIRFDGDTDTEDDSDIEIIGEKKPTGWAYMGSHNFTTSAWGNFQEKSTPFSPIFSVSNYELGIVTPLYSEKEASDIACWERPPVSYAESGSEPWIQSESMHFK